MPLQPVPGFEFQPTHHCITGSMRQIYTFHGHPLSEDMLLGLGEGVSFSYWYFKGAPPFLGGRGNVGIGSQEGLEKTAGRRSGVSIETLRTTSRKRAEAMLLDCLSKGEPVMVGLDMGFLPYFNFDGQEYHFGGHSVVVCGYDAANGEVLVADRDAMHPVSLTVLAQARGSKFKPFPPQNQWQRFDFSQKRPPTPEEIKQAIAGQAKSMLEPPIRNIGVRGIRKAADGVCHWAELMDAQQMRWALFNAYIMISAVGGTGGGNFRYMFSRFLKEASEMLEQPNLLESAQQFEHLGDRWEELAEWFRQESEASNRPFQMDACAAQLRKLSDLEGTAWMHLQRVV